jgi:DNA (cytosine-5)-methyltransferase 1
MPIKAAKRLNVLSLFSGCGGLDLGLEGGFEVLTKSVNREIHPDWIERNLNSYQSLLKETRFRTVLQTTFWNAPKRPGSIFSKIGKGTNASIIWAPSLIW